MINKEIRESIKEFLNEDLQCVILENPSFDNSIVGITENGQLVYLYDSMIKELSIDDGISLEEAADFISYDTLRSIQYAGDNKPIVIYSLNIGDGRFGKFAGCENFVSKKCKYTEKV